MKTIIESLGVYLPPKVVSTTAVLQGCKYKIRFPLERFTGIKSRRMAGEAEFSIDLAKKAIEDCLARSKYAPQDVDLLISSSISRCDGPHFRFTFEPSTSVRLKKHFGFENAVAFDVANACTGMFTAIHVADGLIKLGVIRCAMVVSGEYITHLTLTAQNAIDEFMDPRLASLTLGDAGAAIILEPAPNDSVGFHAIDMFTLGRYSSYCVAKATDDGPMMFTDSVKITEIAVLPAIMNTVDVLMRAGSSLSSVEHIILHQTSRTTLRDATRTINEFFPGVCNDTNTIDNLAERGNTASTSHFVAVMDNILNGRIRSGDNVIFGISGSGQTLGTALYTFDDLPNRLREPAAKRQPPPKRVTSGSAARSPSPRIRVESVGTIPRDWTGQRTSDELCRRAAEDCLERSSHDRSDIDLIIHAGVYRSEYVLEPAVAATIAGQLRINDVFEPSNEKKSFAFDIFNGAVGFLNACFVGVQMIRANKFRTVMVVASEIENNAGVFPEMLRGIAETGSAVILDEAAAGPCGFGNFLFKSFTDRSDALTSYGSYETGIVRLHVAQDPRLEDYYLERVPEVVRELLEIEALDICQLKAIFPPQISSRFIARLSDRLSVSRDRCIDVTGDGADLFTSSLAHAFRDATSRNLVGAGDAGLIIGVGSGIQVGCAIYYF